MASTSPLTSVRDLAERLGQAAVLDVRWKLGGPPGHAEYLRGHVPGAAYVDLETDLADPPGVRGRHPLPDPAQFESAMRRCGVSNNRPVVVYDAVSGTSAARCWWLLRYFGHRDVWLLDGGFPAWEQEGRPVESGDRPTRLGDFVADPGHMAVLDADGAAALARDGLLIDARTPERFRGESEPVDPVAGHIPGAVNVPAGTNLGPDAPGGTGRFRTPDDLAVQYAAAGASSGRAVGAYCGSGVTAAHTVFALEILGVRAALYPGSWSEWLTDPEHPVATGG